jgi:hypothetical protein
MGEEEDLLKVMNKVAESTTAGSSAENNFSTKRSRLGEQRKADVATPKPLGLGIATEGGERLYNRRQ